MKRRNIIGIVIVVAIMLGVKNFTKNEIEKSVAEQNMVPKQISSIKEMQKTPTQITDWRLTLVNFENSLPEDFQIELANIDHIRQFDARAIEPLNQMLEALKESGISNVWVQSAYRSVEHQKDLFQHKINTYMSEGKTKEEAEKITLQTINKPGTSEHNLGLAVDFNYVDYTFDTTKGFLWLQENAENYGFILRYQKEKEAITKVDYEPWHWRYVGVEHARKMKQMDFCLEEYVEYLKDKI